MDSLTKTKIHVTKKLEKLIKKRMGTDQNSDCGILGKWNATVFYIDRKKCWLVTNGLTKYNVILTDIKASYLLYISIIKMNKIYLICFTKNEVNFHRNYLTGKQFQ